MTWQPIETAPKDRSILLWPCGYASTHLEIAFWDTQEEYSEWRREVVSLYEGWVRDDEDQMPIHAPIPITHWMPLPEPPQALESTEQACPWLGGGPKPPTEAKPESSDLLSLIHELSEALKEVEDEVENIFWQDDFDVLTQLSEPPLEMQLERDKKNKESFEIETRRAALLERVAKLEER